MADQRNGGIAWTDQSWNPVRGCSRVSPGCQHCYAETVAARFSGPGQAYEGLAERRSNGEPRWTGKVQLVEKHLTDPLRWTRPRRVFVNSMSDLFHESLSDEAIDRVFAVMVDAFLLRGHVFQVLTKRPERMLAYLSAEDERRARIASWVKGNHLAAVYDPRSVRLTLWPIPGVWLGVSVEDQARADERIPLLLETPAAVRFISAEPLLGPVDLESPVAVGVHALGCGDENCPTRRDGSCRGLDWVIVGGESGPRARPCDVAWIRDLVRQCREAGTACFVKQLGGRPAYFGSGSLPGPDVEVMARDNSARWSYWVLRDRKGGDPAEWPEDLRVREFPGPSTADATRSGSAG